MPHKVLAGASSGGGVVQGDAVVPHVAEDEVVLAVKGQAVGQVNLAVFAALYAEGVDELVVAVEHLEGCGMGWG